MTKNKTPKTRHRNLFMTSKGQTGFFKIPIAFQKYQSTLTQAEKDILLVLFIQSSYENSLYVQIDVETMCYWSGIKRKETVHRAIEGLVRHGWIGKIVYKHPHANTYKLNIEPVANESVIVKLEERKKKWSSVKKKSIQSGEKGKFS